MKIVHIVLMDLMTILVYLKVDKLILKMMIVLAMVYGLFRERAKQTVMETQMVQF